MAISTHSMLRFPYGSGLTNTLFEQEIERPGSVEPGFLPVRSKVKMINLSGSALLNIPSIAMFQLQPNTGYNETVYYHSTTSAFAVNILNSGIDLTKSRTRKDFSYGNGFYVTKDIDKAVDWAHRKARGGTGAIIAFKISIDMEREEPHLSLEAGTARGMELWRKVVYFFRKGIYDPEVVSLVQNKKFITGPVATVNTTPYNFNQTCIHDADYAKRFGRLQNILFVIFI
ncbi:unnamed protein product [Candidula unifasciata]|uniref:DUF3990 domain-containing protein n=1 Tax=Candidula unifasciata TaxID=100452 RepID=A0A8S3YB09_9EUPU|nr:unnamed protein product [Candidula unifasciata]